MKKKFAFLLMGAHYDPARHQADFETENRLTSIRTVRDYPEAQAVIRTLFENGYGAIELCGAFGEEKAQELIRMTQGKVAIGFVTHFPEQDALFAAFFGNGGE